METNEDFKQGEEEGSDSAKPKTVFGLGLPGVENKTWLPKRRMAVMAVLVATLGSFGLGMTLVWTGIAFRSLKETGDLGDLSQGEESLVGSIIYLGALLAAPITGFLISLVGRRKTMLISSLPFVGGWLLIAFAQNVPMLCVGRFICGFCGGTFTVAVPAYVSEVTEDRLKGTLGTVMILMLVFGIEFTFIVGAFVSWFTLSIVGAVVPLIFFFSMLFMPESPRYLVLKRQTTAAKRALQFLRRASTKKHIEPELSQIENSVRASNSHGASSTTTTCTSTTFGDILKPDILKPMGISIALMAFSQLSGMNGVALYTFDVFEQAGTGFDARFALIIVWGAQAMSVLIVTFLLVERYERKTLLQVSQAVMILGLVGFGYSFYAKVDDKIPPELNWLPLTALVAFIVGYNLGMGPLPWLISSEILPSHGKDMASSIVTFFYWTLSFVAGITFKPLGVLLGPHILYWVCAGVTFISWAFVFALVPETKGRSEEEVAKYFNQKNKGVEVELQQTNGDRRSSGGVVNAGFDEVDIKA